MLKSVHRHLIKTELSQEQEICQNVNRHTLPHSLKEKDEHRLFLLMRSLLDETH